MERDPKPDEADDLVLRDSKSGFVFFNVAGHHYDYDATARVLHINDGRLLISREFAGQLGRPADADAVAGRISVTANMTPIEIKTIVDTSIGSCRW